MAEKKVIELDVNTNLGSLKSQLKAAQQEVQTLADKFGATSSAAIEAAKRAADLKDRIGDAKQLTDAFNPDAKFKALGSSLTGVAGGFSAVTGAMGLFGVESQSVEKMILRVNSAMALSQGLNSLGEARDSFATLGNKAITAFKGMTTAGKAFAVTGIGLLITAVALLVTNLDKIKDSFNSGLSSAKKYAETTEKQAEAARKAVDNFDEYVRTLKRIGYEEDEINKRRESAYEKAIADTEKQIEAQKKVLSESKKGLKTAQEFDKLGLNATGRLLYGDEEDVKANRAKSKELTDQLAKLKNDLFAFRADEKKAKEDAKKEEEEKAKENYDNNKKEKDELIKKLKQADQDYQDSLLKEGEREILNVKRKYQALYDEAKKFKLDVTQLKLNEAAEVKAIEDKQEKDLFDGTERLITRKVTVANYTKEFQEQEKKGLAGVAEARKRISDYETKLDEIKKKNLTDALEATAATLGGIANLFGKQTAAGKAAAIAEATISTFLSAQKAYTSTIGIPVVGPVLAPINAGLAIAAGIKNIKEITSVKVPNDTSSASPSGSNSFSGGAISPKFNVVGNSGINQLAQLQQTPTKAYVVSGDVTTAQSLDRNRIENATLVQ